MDRFVPDDQARVLVEEKGKLMFATFTLSSGTPVTVNMSKALYFNPNGDSTTIYFGSLILRVTESYDAVAEFVEFLCLFTMSVLRR